MQIEIHGRNLPLTPPLRAYVDKKLQRLTRFLPPEAAIDIELALERNPRIADSQVAEATLQARGETIRARFAAADMYAAIDGLVDRLRRQVADYHERHHPGRPHHPVKPSTMPVAEAPTAVDEADADSDWAAERREAHG
jgi:putative sigma-54 modulation protein